MFKLVVALLALLSQSRIALADTPKPMAIIGRSGQKFTVNGTPFPLVGFNRYELAGNAQTQACRHWGDQKQWLSYATDIIRKTKALGGNVVRIWAFQAYAGPTGKDFSYLDKVLALARANGVRLVCVLENQWGDCTQGGIKDDAWFSKGYSKPYGYPLSFPDYVDAIVTRYKNDPAVAMWQVMNEAKNYQNPKLMRAFLIDMARFIKSRDPRHLVSSGGALQCWQGAQGAADFESYADDSSIDVLDFHQYEDDTIAWTDCQQSALQAAKALNKPLMIGEIGIKSSSFNAKKRADLFAAKAQEAAKRGVAGLLIWSINLPGLPNFDGYDLFPGEPSTATLKKFRDQWSKK